MKVATWSFVHMCVYMGGHMHTQQNLSVNLFELQSERLLRRDLPVEFTIVVGIL